MTETTHYKEISTETLRQKFIENLPTKMSEGSLLVKLGAQPVAASTDKLVRRVLGAPAAVKEGDLKPTSEFDLEEDEIKRITLTQIVTVTKHSMRREEGRAGLQDLLRQASSHFARGLDTVAFHATNPANGQKLADFASIGIIDNAKTHFYNTGDQFDRVVHEAASEIYDAESVALSRPGYNQLSTMYTEGGLRFYPHAKKDGTPFDLIDMTAVTGRVVGEPAWNGSTSDVLAVPGDYTNLVFGLGEISVEKATEAMIGDVNLFLTNRVAYLVEVEIRLANLNPTGGFAVVRNAA